MSSLENCQDFFTQIVKPDYEDSSIHPLDMRKAIHAAFSTSHMAEWYYNDYADIPNRVFQATCCNEFTAILNKRFVPFGLMRDITNAYKHVEITRGKPKAFSKNPLSIKDLPYPADILLGAKIAFGGPESVLAINLTHNDKEGFSSFHYALGCTVNFWKMLIDNPKSDIESICLELNDLNIIYSV